MLDNDKVRHIAKLARIHLKDDEVEMFRGQLSNVFDYMKILEEANTDGLQETNQVTGLENVMEEDEIFPEQVAVEDLLACSPLPLDGKQIRVRKIIN